LPEAVETQEPSLDGLLEALQLDRRPADHHSKADVRLDWALDV
jgi:hypothetical protein